MKQHNNTEEKRKPFLNTTIPEDWEVKELGEELDDLIAGVSVNSTDEKILDGDLCILKTSAVLGGFFNSKECKKIAISDKKRARTNPQKNSIIISRMNTPNLVGECGYVEENYKNLFLPDRLWQTQFHNNTNIFPKWLNYLLNTNEYKLKIKGSATGTSNSMKNISKDVFLKLKIAFPSLPEQQAIAHLLSTWDKAMEKTEQLLAQKELRKKWLMKQLLTGKKRVKGFENTNWKLQSLDNYIKPVSRQVPKPDKPYLGIGIRSHGKGTFLKYDEQPEGNSMDKFYTVCPYDLIVNITFAWEQAIAIVKPEDDGALASHRFPTFTFIKDKANPDFFKFFILLPLMKYKLDLISPGGAGRNRVMNKSDFIKLEFRIPDYEEQTAIAQILQTADKEIQLLRAKAEQLREQKKGLMQQLLTGKKRLKIKENEIQSII